MKPKCLVLAGVLVCVSIACGTEFDDGRRAAPRATEYDAGVNDSAAPPHPSDGGGAADTGNQVDPSPPACTAEDPDAGGSSAYCSPCKACNGIDVCQDACFGPNCCQLNCECRSASGSISASDARLYCHLFCDGRDR